MTQTAPTIAAATGRGCKLIRDSGSHPTHGVKFAETAGTLDNITINDCDFSEAVTNWFDSSGTPTNLHFRPKNGKGTDITSNTTITIPPDGTIFHVTGTTAITTINVNPWDNGRIVTLIMDSTAQVADGANQKLSAAGPNSADDTLVLHCDGTSWFEIGRSVN